MKDILIVAHFSGEFDGTSNNRFNYICKKLSDRGEQVELVTSSFSHTKKEQRLKSNNEVNYKVTMLDEPSYRNNVSLKRIYSHFKFSKNVKKYLYMRNRPDVIYCAVPSIDVAYEVARFSKRNKIDFVIDIQDLWPEAFKLAKNNLILEKTIYNYIEKKANYIYSVASKIISVSQTYLNRGLALNNNVTFAETVYLGTSLKLFNQKIDNKFSLDPFKFNITYVGTLGFSYDLQTVFLAIKELPSSINICIHLLGDGPEKFRLENMASNLGINAKFYGRLPYNDVIRVLKFSDVCVNSIKANAAQSIINKHADYVAAGKPILNTQDSDEFVRLVENYQIGLNSEPGNIMSLKENILILYNDRELCKIMGRNSLKVAKKYFNRDDTYDVIYQSILE
ncbi:MAG: glycosyltransferase family 4 protein [Clostridia bacterium]|nr:glycosyltransferase family 4 protein [Clostridia bacterium]